MNYAHPLNSIWVMLGFLIWCFSYFKILKKAQIYIPSKYKKRRSIVKKSLGFLIGIIAWSLIGYSIMEPRVPAGFAENKIEVNDIYFVVDVSRSMEAEDFRPNRLEAAKRKILDFVELRPTDRIGLIMFSERAFTLLPLSIDLELVKEMVKEIRMGFLGMGTNIGDALGLAAGRGAQSLAENKVIILLTDGVSNVGNMTPLQAAEEAKKQNIKVYTIGIGNKSSQKVLKNRMGGFGSYQRIPGGSVDLETLEKISKITNGKSFYAKNDEALSEVLKEIQELEKTEINSSGRLIYDEKFYIYLLLGIILLTITEIYRKWLLRESI